MMRKLSDRWTWLCEVLFLLWRGWRPLRLEKVWLWQIVDDGCTFQLLRRNAWLRAKDRYQDLLRLREQLAESRHEVDRCHLLLATTQQILAMRSTDEADELERAMLETRLNDQIRAELAPKKKARA